MWEGTGNMEGAHRFYVYKFQAVIDLRLLVIDFTILRIPEETKRW